MNLIYALFIFQTFKKVEIIYNKTKVEAKLFYTYVMYLVNFAK